MKTVKLIRYPDGRFRKPYAWNTKVATLIIVACTTFVTSQIIANGSKNLVQYVRASGLPSGESTSTVSHDSSTNQRKESHLIARSVLGSPCEELAPHTFDCTDQHTLEDLKKYVKWLDGRQFTLEQAVLDWTKKYPYAKPGVIRTILSVAWEKRYTNIKLAMAIVNCESKFDPKRTNSEGNNPVDSVDRGAWQINSYFEKKISNACSFSASCSTNWAIDQLKAGRKSLWVCSSLINEK